MLNNIICDIESLKEQVYCKTLCNEEIVWLKSLKDKVLPKQEWSEEDKCMLNNVIDTLKPLSQTTHSGYAINSMINWLNSLEPQNKWKPTEEMLEALYRAVPENVMEISEDEMLLDKLYQGLKYGRVLSKK